MTIEQIRDALAKYDKYPKLGDRAYFSFSDIRTLLAEIDRLSKEHDALRARVDELNGLRKYQASLSKDCQSSTMIWGRGAYLATNKTPLAKRLLGSPARPAVMLLASSACSIAGIYSTHAVWFIIAALAFIVSAPF